MNKIIKSIAILVMLILLISSAAFAGGDLIEKCQKRTTKFAKALLANDHATMMSMYADDGYNLPSYSPMLKGKEAMKKHGMEQEKMGIKMKTFSLTVVDVIPGSDLMVEIGTYNLTMAMPGGDKPFPDHGKYVTVWQKQKDGSWKIKADMWNTDVNPMMRK